MMTQGRVFGQNRGMREDLDNVWFQGYTFTQYKPQPDTRSPS